MAISLTISILQPWTVRFPVYEELGYPVRFVTAVRVSVDTIASNGRCRSAHCGVVIMLRLFINKQV